VYWLTPSHFVPKVGNMRLKKSSILRASGVTKGLVSVKKAWKMPMFTNSGFKLQPRLRSGLKMLSRPNAISAKRYGYKTGKKVK